MFSLLISLLSFAFPLFFYSFFNSTFDVNITFNNHDDIESIAEISNDSHDKIVEISVSTGKVDNDVNISLNNQFDREPKVINEGKKISNAASKPDYDEFVYNGKVDLSDIESENFDSYEDEYEDLVLSDDFGEDYWEELDKIINNYEGIMNNE